MFLGLYGVGLYCSWFCCVMSQLRELTLRRGLLKQQEQDDNRTEMANLLYGDFLTENPAAAQSSFGFHRVIPDRWKGMTPEQLADIRRRQEIQRRENQVRITNGTTAPAPCRPNHYRYTCSMLITNEKSHSLNNAQNQWKRLNLSHVGLQRITFGNKHEAVNETIENWQLTRLYLILNCVMFS